METETQSSNGTEEGGNKLFESSNGASFRESKPHLDGTSAGDQLEITIIEAEKRMNKPLALKEYYSVYLIETKVLGKNGGIGFSSSGPVWRRYSEFEQLRMHLENTYPDAIIPPLPEKRATFTRYTQSSDNVDPVFVDRRRVGLESFLVRVSSHPRLSLDPLLLKFLQGDQEWADPAQIPDGGMYVQQAEFKLKSMSVALRLRKPDENFENLRHYSSELQTIIAQLLRSRVRQADRLYAIHKLHANYGRVFSEWSALEKKMGDGLQRAGHYMDCYASAIETHLEEEDIVADQLKEYLNFGQSLQALCSRHHMAQFQLEKAEAHLVTQKNQKDKYKANDNTLSKLWGKWTGSRETEEDKITKIRTMEQNVNEAENQVHTATTQLSQFTRRAEKEVDRFQEQKNRDLRESLTNYVMLQLKLCKMGLQTWKHIKGALEEIP